MGDQRAIPPAVLASILLHLAVVATARSSIGPSPSAPVSAPEAEPVDIWAGDTASLPGGGRPQAGHLAGAAAPQAPQAPQPAPAPASPARATGAEQGSERAAVKSTAAPVRPARSPERAATKDDVARTKARSPSRNGSAGTRSGGGDDDGGEQGGQFSAAGSSAVRSLGRAFTRAIPPACQADPAWASLPAGSAGKARFVVEVDGAGHIASWKQEGEARPPRHLENLMKRTIALLGSGTFAVGRGAVTAGRQTLEIGAELSERAAGSDADATADLAWRFEAGRGNASFTQPGGRHVELTVRVVRTEAATEPPG